jgi:glycosyltransferase involved in cell wall biosynthesis
MRKTVDVLVLTIDQQIDRRILNAVSTMEKHGLSVFLQTIKTTQGRRFPSKLKQWLLFCARGLDSANVRRITSRHLQPIVRYGANLICRCLCLSLNSLRDIRSRCVSVDKIFFRLLEASSENVVPRLVIANDLPTLSYAAKVARLHRTPLIYDSHELFPEQEFTRCIRTQWKRLEKRYIRKATSVITVNESIARELSRRYNRSEITVVLNAENSVPDRSRGSGFSDVYKPGTKIILYQGGFSPGRYLPELIQSMAFIADPEVLLVLLGSGPEKSTMVRTIHEYALEERVKIHDAVAQHELLDFTASAHLGVIPYRATCLNNKFCTPNKLFEFIAAGLPFVATDLVEIRRIVDRYEIGIVGATDTPRALAYLLDEALCNRERYEVWKKNIKNAQREVSWDVEGEKYLRVVKAALPTSRQPRSADSVMS